MSINHLTQFPIENLTMNLNNIQLTLLAIGLVEFLLLHILLDRKRIYNFFKTFHSSIFQSQFIITPNNSKDQIATDNGEKRVNQSVSREEMELVLCNLGISPNFEGKKLPEKLDADEISNQFEEKSPNLGELKEAFGVFDKNGDGFIDAVELQSVMCALGFKEGLQMENCRRMIGAFDENGDERIDFEEFVKFNY